MADLLHHERIRSLVAACLAVVQVPRGLVAMASPRVGAGPQDTGDGTGSSTAPCEGAPRSNSDKRRRVCTPLYAVECAVYAAVIAAAFVGVTPHVSRRMLRECRESRQCAYWLRPGAFDGTAVHRATSADTRWRVDLGDAQWRDLRSNGGALVAGMVLFCAASYALRLFLRRTVGGGDGSGGGSVDVAATGAAGRSTVVRVRVWFYLLVSACTLAYLHGSSTVFVVALALGNYAIGAAAGCYQWRWPTSDITIAVGPLATWAYCIGVLFMNEWYHDHMTFGGLGLRSAAWLDRYRGVYRWHLGFNLVMLRMVSFNMDRYWQLRWHAQGHATAKRRDEGGATTSAAASVPIAVATATRSQGGTDGSTTGAATQSVGAYMSYRWRQHTHAPASDYNVAHYLAYLFYVPLYLAGPTITFNAWASQVRVPQRSVSRLGVVRYAVRWLVAACALEVWLHYFPVYAASRASLFRVNRWPPYMLLTFAWLMVNALWLKFLVLWRFFRLWALCDGIETVENMNRCVNNNYTLTGFWRAWHRSFNQWLVRYIYVPLGGRGHRLRNVWLVFTFVALWHDMTLKLLAWGWLLALFFVPETLLGGWVASQTWLTSKWYYRHIVASGAVANIGMLVIANLVGFAVGTTGTGHLVSGLLTVEGGGLTHLAVTVGILFSAAQLMLCVRRLEG